MTRSASIFGDFVKIASISASADFSRRGGEFHLRRLFGAGRGREHLLHHGRRTAQAAHGHVLDAGFLRVPGDDFRAGRAKRVVDAAAPHHIGAFEHGDHRRQVGLQDLHAAFGAALQRHRAALAIDLVDAGDIGDLFELQALGDAGADLRGVAVDGLLAAEHDVDLAEGVADLLQRRREREGRGQRVGAGEEAVGEQNGAVGADGHGLSQGIAGHGRAHGEHGDLAAHLVAPAQGLFQREQVIGVDDGRHALPHDRVGHRMDADLRRIWDLFDANDKMHIRLRRIGPSCGTKASRIVRGPRRKLRTTRKNFWNWRKMAEKRAFGRGARDVEATRLSHLRQACWTKGASAPDVSGEEAGRDSVDRAPASPAPRARAATVLQLDFACR